MHHPLSPHSSLPPWRWALPDLFAGDRTHQRPPPAGLRSVPPKNRKWRPAPRLTDACGREWARPARALHWWGWKKWGSDRGKVPCFPQGSPSPTFVPQPPALHADRKWQLPPTALNAASCAAAAATSRAAPDGQWARGAGGLRPGPSRAAAVAGMALPPMVPRPFHCPHLFRALG